MAVNKESYTALINELKEKEVTLVAVSKTKPVEEILALYQIGQRDFGENYVQELISKQAQLPSDIRWHFIGHLQTNKVKNIIPFIHLIQGVDSYKLLAEVARQAHKTDRQIYCLLQVHIASEETKFGFDETELDKVITELGNNSLPNICVNGFMGMASFTNEMDKVRSEFKYLKSLFDKYAQVQTTNFKLQTLSMGMSSDYRIAVEEGSNMVRVGSLLFGART
jgi:pyridoxal phosphate enzyme (YggS family)